MTSKILNHIKIFAFISFLLLFERASAQSYIEVSVQDTIMLKADYFVYTFMVNNYTYTPDTIPSANETRNQTGNERQQKNFTAIINELKKNGFKFYAPTIIDTVTINASAESFLRSGTILMYSLDSLKLASRVLRQFDNLSAYVQSKKMVTPADEKRLYKKLVEMASLRAQTIAQLSGRKLKQLESVTQKQLERGASAYISGEGPDIPGWHTYIGTPAFASTSNEIYYPIGSAFTVRFSLQP